MSDVTDAMDRELADALAVNHYDDEIVHRKAISVLAVHLSTWKSQAEYWRGRCEGQEETIAYLKERVEVLEAREVLP